MVLLFCVAVTETAEGQYTQSEEHSNKLKQLLMKTKKDLADAKKLVLLLTCAVCSMLVVCMYSCAYVVYRAS